MQLALPCAINCPPERGRGRDGQFLIITASRLGTFACNKSHAWEKYVCVRLLNNLSGKKPAHARRAWGSIQPPTEVPKCNTNPFLFGGGHKRYLHKTCPLHTHCSPLNVVLAFYLDALGSEDHLGVGQHTWVLLLQAL